MISFLDVGTRIHRHVCGPFCEFVLVLPVPRATKIHRHVCGPYPAGRGSEGAGQKLLVARGLARTGKNFPVPN